jgi:hypothetical protein
VRTRIVEIAMAVLGLLLLATAAFAGLGGTTTPQPNQAPAFWGTIAALTSVGAVLLATGIALVVRAHHQTQWLTHVVETGFGVDADIQAIAPDPSISVNGKHPFKVVCQWVNPQTRQVHVFESAPIWYDPSSYLEHAKMRVFIDRDDPSKYLVDIRTLPKLAA